MELQWEGVQGGVQKWMRKGGVQGGGCKTVVQTQGAKTGFAVRELQGRDATRNCNVKGCEEGCRSGCTKEGRKEGLQSGGANAGCNEWLCNRADCIQVMLHGIAIGRGARRGATWMHEGGAQGGVAKRWCKSGVQSGALQ